MKIAVAGLLAVVGLAIVWLSFDDDYVATSKPNIILILTDDQDKGTLHPSVPHLLPRTAKHLVQEGTYYENFFAPVSVCCPSRVSLLRTQYAHNHNITYVTKPWGGWEVFNNYGYVGKTLPDWLQRAGYDTFYVGKLMNDHTADNCESLPVSGFTSSDFLVDPYTYDYWNPGFSRDNGPVKVYKNQYSTDILARKSIDYLKRALEFDRPFMLTIAPIAPHSWIDSKRLGGGKDFSRGFNIPASAPRHANLFATERAPRHESWNPDEPHGVSWVRQLPKLNTTQEYYLDEFYRGRLRALQAVDELVERVVEKVEKAGKLDNTYIIYTADNGFAIGSHRRQPGKTLGFEEDIHVPLVIRGPGVKRGFVDKLSSYGIVDLSRTILELAGAKTDHENDGVKINLHDANATVPDSAHGDARHSITEYWVLGGEEGIYATGPKVNNTYRTLRVHDEVDGRPVTWSYSVWCTGERELYDLVDDPYQVRNLLAPLNALGPFPAFDAKGEDGRAVLPRSLQRTLHRLDALTLVLKTCLGDTCRRPYAALFPDHAGEVVLQHALHRRYDGYFESLPKVHFSDCRLGFQTRNEKPEWSPDLAFPGLRAPAPAPVPPAEPSHLPAGSASDSQAVFVVQ
ncbi:hypothetical protein VHUM_02937 [Vanrija humicola]|uniref:Arylsulfatase n=1 Tax=Vanrija humicola TaxID=5417 RepID=A0A7D8V0U5_VANHU|nr:hypothetical protein VHUM_02937 [Vanrija humicola]